MKINKLGLDLIKTFESCKLKPYLDIVGVCTIGYGTTTYEDGRKVAMTDPAITEERAIQLLAHHIEVYERCISNVVKTVLNENEFSACVSLCYNIGAGAFSKSTLVKHLNAGKRLEASLEFLRWNKAGGVAVKGLTRRREAEKELFLKAVPVVIKTPIPIPYVGATVSATSLLPNGPSEEDIRKALVEIESQIKPK